MLRLFITIISAILITLFSVSFGIGKLANKLVTHYEEPFNKNTFKGVFALLDNAVKDTKEQDYAATLLALQGQFKFPLYLREPSELQFPQAVIDSLEAGKVHMADIDGADYLYVKSKHSNRVWELATELNNYDDNVAITVGPFELILEQLTGKPLADQQDTIVRIASDFSMPVLLSTLHEINFTDDELARLNANLVVARTPGQNGERYYRQVPDSDAVVQIGPIPFPGIIKIITPLVMGSFVVLLCLCSFIWIGPLWRDLQRLISTSDRIADGQLDSRVQSSTPSMIKPVIEGFNRMADQTQNMIASQQALTNAVSHELRTPLARLKFSLEIASQTESDNLRARHHQEMGRDLDELNQMVDELLTFARYDRIASDFDIDQLPRIQINDWMKSQVERSTRGLPSHCSVTYESTVPVDERTRFHSRLMSYALSNGLGNAIRYANSTVKVNLIKQNQQYVLHIDDDGPGIDETLRQTMFEPFRRVDESRSRDSGGFGLGLSIVSKVAGWHDGHAQILDSDLGGVRLQIDWPVAEECTKTSTTGLSKNAAAS